MNIHQTEPKSLPENIRPILETVRERFFSADSQLDFWRGSYDPSMINGFMDLAAHLQLAIFDGQSPESWPPGYTMLMVLFAWESSAQADGWSQYFESSDGEIDAVCMLYTHVELPEEAEAIRRARSVAEVDDDPSAVSAAYDAESHDYSGDLDRLEYLAKWFCEGADELLYAE